MPRILQITDPHVLTAGSLAYGVVDTGAALERTVAGIRTALPRIGPIDLVVVTGDVVDNGTAAQYARFIEIMAPLGLPLRAVPGNHDARDLMRNAFASTDWMPRTGAIRWRYDLGGACVIGLDTLVPGAPHGALGPETLDWLANELAQAGHVPLIVAMHHPPIPTGIVQMDRQGLQAPEALQAILERHPGPVRIIAGHVHRLVMGSLGTVPVITGPGTSHAVTLDLRPARSATFDMEPGGVLIHDAGPEGIRSHLLPLGDWSGPHPFAG
ncbi:MULTISPECIES: phosphodiesterase [Mameliella]|uniref:phosphodiesterase n=1 Tax=Mameliella TaxID=1434019 RepID=UPI0012FFB7A4|nr:MULTISPECIES: phosphodiesterase [Mameliella]MCR9271939.1 phosphodiesterase [Paracoccaceae bacterium]